MEIKNQFAQKLMEIQAIKLQPNEPFTWASGWKSPIYTDNRKTLSFPRLRSFVKLELCHAIQENFPEAEAVAGVATGAIAQGALVAEELGLPYSYVGDRYGGLVHLWLPCSRGGIQGGWREAYHIEQLRGCDRRGCQNWLYQGRGQGRSRRMAQEPRYVETINCKS